jgi:hypothetical protein
LPFHLHYKTVSLFQAWAQMRQISCESCRESFVYLASGAASARVAGLPLLSSTEGMHKKAEDILQRDLTKRALKPRQGWALCPHCQRYQSWMVRRRNAARLVLGLVVGLVLGGIGAAVLLWTAPFELRPKNGIEAFWNRIDKKEPLVPIWLPAVFPPVLAIASGLFWARRGKATIGPHLGEGDRVSMTVAAFQEFLLATESAGEDATVVWWRRMGDAVREGAAVAALAPLSEDGRFPGLEDA